MTSSDIWLGIQNDYALWTDLLREHPLLWLPTLVCLVPCLRIAIGFGCIAAGYSVLALAWVFLKIVNFKARRTQREMARRGW